MGARHAVNNRLVDHGNRPVVRAVFAPPPGDPELARTAHGENYDHLEHFPAAHTHNRTHIRGQLLQFCCLGCGVRCHGEATADGLLCAGGYHLWVVHVGDKSHAALESGPC